MARGAILVLVVLLSRPVSADIVAWQDAAGVRHYTNLAALVPEAYRNVARVVVDEAARQGAEPAPAETERPDDAGVRSDRMQATTALDREALAQAYLAGLQRGLTAEDLQNRAPSVVFNGPCSVGAFRPARDDFVRSRTIASSYLAPAVAGPIRPRSRWSVRVHRTAAALGRQLGPVSAAGPTLRTWPLWPRDRAVIACRTMRRAA
jgi:hypothetical protein